MAEWAKTAARAAAAYYTGGASEAALAASKSGGGGGKRPLPPQKFDGRDVINIAPNRSNVGEIIKQFYGPTENGGFEDPGSGFVQSGKNFEPISAPRHDPEGSTFPWGTAAAVVGGGTVLFLLMRGF